MWNVLYILHLPSHHHPELLFIFLHPTVCPRKLTSRTVSTETPQVGLLVGLRHYLEALSRGLGVRKRKRCGTDSSISPLSDSGHMILSEQFLMDSLSSADIALTGQGNSSLALPFYFMNMILSSHYYSSQSVSPSFIAYLSLAFVNSLFIEISSLMPMPCASSLLEAYRLALKGGQFHNPYFFCLGCSQV